MRCCSAGQVDMKKTIIGIWLILMMLAVLIAGCAQTERISASPIPVAVETTIPEPTPEPELLPKGTAAGRSKLKLFVGQKRRYRFTQNGTELGRNEYEVVGEETKQGTKFFTLKSDLLVSYSARQQPTIANATLRIDDRANPISYQLEAYIGSG